MGFQKRSESVIPEQDPSTISVKPHSHSDVSQGTQILGFGYLFMFVYECI